MPDEAIREERDTEGKPIRRCDSTTFSQVVGRVDWLEPQNLFEWLFGRKATFWQCAKCGEEFSRRPKGQCNADLSRSKVASGLNVLRRGIE